MTADKCTQQIDRETSFPDDGGWPDTTPIVIVGPTAVGKTSVAIELANQLSGEIINADSMQVYRGMDIGTDKPGVEDRRRAAFHLLDLKDPDEQLTVAEWKDCAQAAICDIARRDKTVIICGGTGLYIHVLLNNLALASTPSDGNIRRRLQADVDERGPLYLHSRLALVDAETAARLHPNDTLRVIRALEVFETTGEPISAIQKRDRLDTAERPAMKFGLTASRELIYRRINARVDRMILAGLEGEVRRLLSTGLAPGVGPMKSLGFSEMCRYINGECSLEVAVEEIKRNTRRYAKRQQTWFRADDNITWIDVTDLSPAAVAEHITATIEARRDGYLSPVSRTN